MNYTVTTSSKKLDIIDEQQNVVCQLQYESLTNYNANFTLNNNQYHIKAANVWQSKYNVLKNDKDIGDIDFNWKGEIILRLINEDGMTKHFILKVTNVWSSKFELRDFLTEQLWSIHPELKWTSMSYHYTIKSEEGLHREENKVNLTELLAMTMYGVQLMLAAAAAAG